jgi:AraC-like DNA-binding protein
VQLLFEEDGETFTDYVMEQRLVSAYRMLREERFRHLTIAAIAYRAGFGDLSHFNRNFKRRFGDTPSEIRRVALSRRRAGDADEAGEVR